LILAALAADTVWILPKEVSNLIQWTDTAVCIVLLTDFLVRLYCAESKRAFMKWGWIDLVASIPSIDVLRWGRVVRVLTALLFLGKRDEKAMDTKEILARDTVEQDFALKRRLFLCEHGYENRIVTLDRPDALLPEDMPIT
jgi:hypothetical protein